MVLSQFRLSYVVKWLFMKFNCLVGLLGRLGVGLIKLFMRVNCLVGLLRSFASVLSQFKLSYVVKKLCMRFNYLLYTLRVVKCILE